MNTLSTGQVAQLLGCTEPQLNNLIRRARIEAPPVVAGRRAWRPTHIAEAARALGLRGSSGSADLREARP